MNTLITGGAGFVGANLVRALLAENHSIRILDNFSAGTRHHLDGLDVEIVMGDILERGDVEKAVTGMDGVVHLAAQAGVPTSIDDPFYDCNVNVLGTLNMLDACRLAGVKRFIFASSNAPLGRQAPPATEDKAPLPISPYGASKLAGEAYCLAYHGTWGLGTIVLRFANLYGPWSGHKKSVVAKFFQDISSSGAITINGTGSQTRDMIYVGDLCQAVILALKSDIGGEIFQIATGIETSIADLANMIMKVVGSEVVISHAPPRQGDIDKNYSQITKAGEILGWRAEMELGAGLRKTWDWFDAETHSSISS